MSLTTETLYSPPHDFGSYRNGVVNGAHTTGLSRLQVIASGLDRNRERDGKVDSQSFDVVQRTLGEHVGVRLPANLDKLFGLGAMKWLPVALEKENIVLLAGLRDGKSGGSDLSDNADATITITANRRREPLSVMVAGVTDRRITGANYDVASGEMSTAIIGVTTEELPEHIIAALMGGPSWSTVAYIPSEVNRISWGGFITLEMIKQARDGVKYGVQFSNRWGLGVPMSTHPNAQLHRRGFYVADLSLLGKYKFIFDGSVHPDPHLSSWCISLPSSLVKG